MAKALKLTEYRSVFTIGRAVDSWIVHFSSNDKWSECCWFHSSFSSLFLSFILLLPFASFSYSPIIFFYILRLNAGIFHLQLEKLSILWLSTGSSIQHKHKHTRKKCIKLCSYKTIVLFQTANNSFWSYETVLKFLLQKSIQQKKKKVLVSHSIYFLFVRLVFCAN